MGEPQRGDRVGQLKQLYYGGRKTVFFSTQRHPSFCAGQRLLFVTGAVSEWMSTVQFLGPALPYASGRPFPQ